MSQIKYTLGLGVISVFMVATTLGCASTSDGQEETSAGRLATPPPVAQSCGAIGGDECPAGLECARDGLPPYASGYSGPPSNAGGHCVPIPIWSRCETDSDVVAVQANGCCSTGYLEAVNKAYVAEYQASFDPNCEDVLCAAEVHEDYRLPECINGRARMVEIDDILCGGHGPNPHECPYEYSCEGPGGPAPVDAPGSCVSAIDLDP